MAIIWRRFADIAEGQAHYRTAGDDDPPLVMFHMSPTSSQHLEPPNVRLGGSRRVIAPDMLGNGHISPTQPVEPDLLYFAEAALQALDALGIEKFDVFDAHNCAGVRVGLSNQGFKRLAGGRCQRVVHIILKCFDPPRRAPGYIGTGMAGAPAVQRLDVAVGNASSP